MTTLSRRSFVFTAASAAAAGTLTRSVYGYPAAEQVRVGLIGIAGRGDNNLVEVEPAGGKIVALCDVDQSRTAKARKQFPNASFDVDFRKLLDRKDIDAVLISTPDHTHFPAAALALDSGRHVYCEKPLTHTVEEARILQNLAAKKNRVTQMGTQIHAGNNYRRVVEQIQGGAIGAVKEAHVWCAKSWGGKGVTTKTGEKVPETLDYDLWVGGAPMREYSSSFVPFNWRRYWNFGAGTLGDMGCHFIDLTFWALKLKYPTQVSAEGTPVHADTAADDLTARWEFPAREGMSPVTLYWHDGGRKPKVEGLKPWDNGVLFIGEKGMLQADYGQHVFINASESARSGAKISPIANSIGHYKEWIEAMKGNGKTSCSFDYSGPLTESVLLGVAAYRAGKSFKWDAANLKASEEAVQALLSKNYRAPWDKEVAGFKSLAVPSTQANEILPGVTQRINTTTNNNSTNKPRRRRILNLLRKI